MATMNFKFSKAEKLKSKALIDALFSRGKSVTTFPVRLYYLPIEDVTISTYKVGVSVPKRNFKIAVKRNTIKRLLREAYRNNKHIVHTKTTQHYALLFVFIGKKPPDYETIESKLKTCLKKFIEHVV